MKKLMIIILILAASASAFIFLRSGKKKNSDGYRPVTAFRGEISSTIDTTGDVEPMNRVEVKSSVSGRVDELLVDEGYKVRAGQTLALMSSNDRVAILDAARSKGPEELEYWQDTYKQVRVLSPLNGTVIFRNVVEGQTVDLKTILFAISDNLIVTANVDESDIGRIRPGQRAEITLDAYPGKKVSGTVFQILQEGKNVNNIITYKVKIKPFKVPEYFKSQMTANILIEVVKHRDILLLPYYAVKENSAGEQTVVTGFKNGGPVRAFVKTGIEDGSNIEIVAGLSENETVYYPAQEYVPQKKTMGKSPLIPQRTRRAGKKKPGRKPK